MAMFRPGSMDGCKHGVDGMPHGAAATDREAADLVLMPESLVQVTDGEIDGLFATVRMALRPAGQLVVAVPNDETLDQFLSLCPASGTLFHMAQRLRAFSPNAL